MSFTVPFPSLEALRKEGRVGRTKLAGILRRLASVAREIEDVEDGESVSYNTSRHILSSKTLKSHADARCY